MSEPIQQLTSNNQGRSHREQVPFTLLARKEKVSDFHIDPDELVKYLQLMPLFSDIAIFYMKTARIRTGNNMLLGSSNHKCTARKYSSSHLDL